MMATMGDTALDRKIMTEFGAQAVDKRVAKQLGISGDDRHIPRYVLDWIVTYLSAQPDRASDLSARVAQFVSDHLPTKSEREAVKFRLTRGQVVTVLDAVSVEVHLDPPAYYAAVPCLDERRVLVSAELIERHPALLAGNTWGAARLCLDAKEQAIRMVEFHPMQTGRVSLEAYRAARRAFSVEEWLALIVRTLGYEADAYSEEEQLWLAARLLPVVMNRVNMMELAPPGSGKSYVYNNVSRYVWLTSAQITPAVLFYHRGRRTPGLLSKYDLVVLDEAQSIRFSDPAEIQAQLKGYLEQGVFARGDVEATAECGLMLLANIELFQDYGHRFKNGQPAFLPAQPDYIRRLPDVFLDPALLDRFHGIIPGWRIPPFETTHEASGWGLKSDYFAEVCHALRGAADISQRVRPALGYSGYKRDCTAVERLACGLAKLLLIDPDHPRFEALVVAPAERLRLYVREQLSSLDPHAYQAGLQCRRGDRSGAGGAGEDVGSYRLRERLAEGSTACVFRAVHRATGAIVAVKRVRVPTDGRECESAEREVRMYELLRELAHPNILLFHEVVRTPAGTCIVMEYADGGSLWDLVVGADGRVRRLSPQDAVRVVAPIVDAVGAMHQLGVVHRDIKPQNILRSDDQWKLADFGISKWVSSASTGGTFQGAHSAPWAPPEQTEGAPAHPSADVYALGRVLGFLLTGSKEKRAVQGLDARWQELLGPCLSDEPGDRPSAVTMAGMLADRDV